MSTDYCPHCKRKAKDWEPRLVICGCYAHIRFPISPGADGRANEIASIVELCHHLPPAVRARLPGAVRPRLEMVLEYSQGHPL